MEGSSGRKDAGGLGISLIPSEEPLAPLPGGLEGWDGAPGPRGPFSSAAITLAGAASTEPPAWAAAHDSTSFSSAIESFPEVCASRGSKPFQPPEERRAHTQDWPDVGAQGRRFQPGLEEKAESQTLKNPLSGFPNTVSLTLHIPLAHSLGSGAFLMCALVSHPGLLLSASLGRLGLSSNVTSPGTRPSSPRPSSFVNPQPWHPFTCFPHFFFGRQGNTKDSWGCIPFLCVFLKPCTMPGSC